MNSKKLFLFLLFTFLLGTNVFAKNKVLIVFSGMDYVSVQGGGTHPTGYFFPELATPLKLLIKAGYEVTMANPNGQTIVMDKISDSPQWFKTTEDYNEAKDLIQLFSDNLKSPVKLSTLSNSDLKNFDGVFLPGGHAPMEDLYKDKDLGRILKHFHKNQKPTALICHAPVALLSAKDSDGWIYSGYKMTVFSNAEEKQEEDAGHLDGKLNFYVADALISAGGIVSVAKPWSSNVVWDKELITAQNPMSDLEFGKTFIEALTHQKIRRLGNVVWEDNHSVIRKNVLYVASLVKTNWSQGHVTLFIGEKKENLNQKDFFSALKSHVNNVRNSFQHNGLQDYVFFTDGKREFALQSWKDQESMVKAFQTLEGEDVRKEASEIFNLVYFDKANQIPDYLNFPEKLEEVTPLEVSKIFSKKFSVNLENCFKYYKEESNPRAKTITLKALGKMKLKYFQETTDFNKSCDALPLRRLPQLFSSLKKENKIILRS